MVRAGQGDRTEAGGRGESQTGIFPVRGMFPVGTGTSGHSQLPTLFPADSNGVIPSQSMSVRHLNKDALADGCLSITVTALALMRSWVFFLHLVDINLHLFKNNRAFNLFVNIGAAMLLGCQPRDIPDASLSRAGHGAQLGSLGLGSPGRCVQCGTGRYR